MPSYNTKPVIGILAQEISRKVIPEHIEGNSYIASSYVRHMEDSGADVVPILIDSSHEDLARIFKSINGMLIPGGGASLTDSEFIKNVRILCDMAVNANKVGTYFPIWGTCLGLEAMLVLCGGYSVLGDADATDLSMPTVFTDDVSQSKVFNSTDQKMSIWFTSKPVKYHYHKKCVYMKTFHDSEELNSQYSVICYDEDREKRPFVSFIEGKKFPFYGVQWHPEKVAYETIAGLDIPRTSEAVAASKFLGDFFVNEAKKNKHCFSTLEEKDKHLIKNYKEEDTGDLGRILRAYIF